MATVEELLLRINQRGGERTSSSIRNLGDVIRRLSGYTETTGSAFGDFGMVVGNISAGLRNAGTTLTRFVTKPIVDLGLAAIKTTMDFDKQMSRVMAVTGATGDEFDTMRSLALKMGKTTSKTATEAAQAIEYMGLAGWGTGDIMQGLEPILRASEAGAMDLGLTSDLVTDSMGALGIGTKDLTRYLDIAAKTSVNSNTSLQQFLEAMVTGGGMFESFNIPLEEAGALLGVMADKGIKGSEAGNSLIAVMNALTSGTGDAGKAMKELEVEVYDSEGEFRGMTTILNDINEKFADMTVEQRNTYMQMIGGRTRFKDFKKLLQGAAGNLKSLTKELYNADGSLSKMAKTMQDNLSGQVTRLKSAFEGMLIQIGDYLTPVISKLATFVQKLADGFLNLSSPAKGIILVMLGIVAAIGPVILGLGILGGIVSGVITLFTLIGTIVSYVGAPFIALAGILAIVIPAFIGLLLSSEKLRNGIVGVFNNIKNKVGGAISFIKTHIEDIKTAFKGFIDFMMTGNFDKSFDDMRDALKNMFPKADIDGIIMKFVDFRQKVINIRDKIIDFGTKVMDVFSNIKDSLAKAFSNFKIEPIITAFGNFKAAVQPLMPVLKILGTILLTVIATAIGIAIGGLSGFIAALDNIVAMIVNVFGIIQSILGIAIGLIVGLFTGNWSMLTESARALWENIKGFFVNGITAIWDFVSNFVTTIIGFFKSLYMAIVGGSIIPDLVNGVIRWFAKLISKPVAYVKSLYAQAKAYFNMVKSTVFAIVSALVSRVVNYFSNLYSGVRSKLNSVKSVASSIWNSIKSVVSSAANNISSKVSSAFSRVVSAIKSKLNSAKSVVGSAMSGIVSKISGVASKLYSAGRNIILSLVNGIKSMVGAVGKAVTNIVKSARDKLPFSPAKEGPLKDLDKTGPAFINTIIKGLKKRQPKLQEIVADLSANLSNVTNLEPRVNTEIPYSASPAQIIVEVSGNNIWNNKSIDELGNRLVRRIQSSGIRTIGRRR